MRLDLARTEDTEALGARLAAVLAPADPHPPLLMEGPLGSGKTTLVRALVAALPGGDQARVSSPSFTVCNLYPTTPETAHLDLYRLEGQGPAGSFPGLGLDEDLLDLVHEGGMRDGRVLALVEWAEHLQGPDRPGDALVLRWLPAETGRRIEFTATGPVARACLAALEQAMPEPGSDG